MSDVAKNKLSLRIKRNKRTAWITFNRPAKCNALNLQMLQHLADFFSKESSDFDHIILLGEGKHFCAGADLHCMHAKEQSDPGVYSALFATLLQHLKQPNIFTVAAVQGACYGGAMGIIAACDYVIADPNTHFSCPEIKHNLVPKLIYPILSQQLTSKQCKQLMLMGKTYNVNQMQRWLLVDEIIPNAEQKSHLMQWCNTVSTFDPETTTKILTLMQKDTH